MNLTVYTDGGALNNPGPAGIGFLIFEKDTLLYEHSEAIGVATNNVAEYTALIRALTYVKVHYQKKLKRIDVIADSELMIRQMNGIYKVKHPDLKPLYMDTKILESELPVPISYTHVLREKNAAADALVKKALGR